MIQIRSRIAALCCAAFILAGCASVPEDQGRGEVLSMIAERGIAAGDEDMATLADTLLSRPLTANDAVRLALLRNPQVLLTYAELGFGVADIHAAASLSNPEFSVASLSDGGASMLTLGLTQSFTDLLTLSARGRIAETRFEAVKRRVASELFGLALDVETAFFDLAEAQALERLRADIAEVTDVSAELARRIHAAGNLSRLELAIAEAAASEVKLELAEAEIRTAQARATLARLLGIEHGVQWQIADRLPQMPHHDEGLTQLVKLAFASRLDLDAGRRDVEHLADTLGLVRRFRWLGDIRVGLEREREGGEDFTGPTLAIEIPVFNRHKDQLSRAEAQVLEAEAKLAQRHLAVGHEVELAWKQMRAARLRANEHRERLLPLRAAIVDETHRRVNFMLADVFDALQARELEYRAQQRAVMAEHDYWRARIALRRAVGTALPMDAHIQPAPVPAEEPEAEDHGHHHMHGAEKKTESQHDHGKVEESNEHRHHQPQAEQKQEEHHHDHAS